MGTTVPEGGGQRATGEAPRGDPGRSNFKGRGWGHGTSDGEPVAAEGEKERWFLGKGEVEMDQTPTLSESFRAGGKVAKMLLDSTEMLTLIGTFANDQLEFLVALLQRSAN